MQGLDHLLERAKSKRARDQRLEEARAAFMKLAPDEREELLIALLAEMDASTEKVNGSPGAEPTPAAEQTPLLSAAYNSGAKDAAAALGIHESRPIGYGIKEAIIDAVRDGRARTAGEIAKATTYLHPWVNVGSIPAAIQRMASEIDPPLLTKRGKNDRGHPLYVIAAVTMIGGE